MSPQSKPTMKDRGAAGRRARRPSATVFGVMLAVSAAVLVPVAPSAASTAHAPAERSAAKPKTPRAIATAPFATPIGVTLADAPPPWALPADARPYIAAAGLSVLDAEQLAVHYHVHVDIIAGGAEVTVPAGIGFVVSHGKATGITVLHTHDTSGVVHVESAKPQPYTLGQVFAEWGVALSATQLGGLHADGTHVLVAYVNGQRFTGDPATLQLTRHLEIALWYGPSGETPRVPKSYKFTGGL